VLHTAPGHVDNVRRHVIDALTPEQIHQLANITDAVLERFDPDAGRIATYQRYDPDPPDVR